MSSRSYSISFDTFYPNVAYSYCITAGYMTANAFSFGSISSYVRVYSGISSCFVKIFGRVVPLKSANENTG
jgi:hypothetical protein